MSIINPTRNSQFSKISRDWKRTPPPGGDTGTTRPTDSIVIPKPPKGDTGPDLDKFPLPVELIDKIKASLKAHSIVFDDFPFGAAPYLFELQKRGEKTVVVYNTDHEFYKVFSALKHRVARSGESNSNDLLILFDFFITSYGWAESAFHDKEELGDPYDHFSDMRIEWGKKLRDFAVSWHKQTGVKDDDESL